MYLITLTTEGNHPVKLLLNDLIQARERGVEVTLYLNTYFRDTAKDKSFFMKNPTLQGLKDAGCTVHLIPSRYRLHDKLVIVDNRYVVEGSTNWSISGLRRNFESSTLIDSPGLAGIKLKRLEDLLIRTRDEKEPLPTPGYAERLPEALTIPKELLLNKGYFPKMVSTSDDRAMELYILLLAHSQLTGKDEFFVSLEDMGLSLGLPRSWSNTQLRRQAIRSLRKLKFRYDLIDVKFFFAKNAYVTVGAASCREEHMAQPAKQSQTFTIPASSIIQPYNKALTTRLKFFLLVQALLKEEGEDIDSISNTALGRRFGVSEGTFRAALKDREEFK